MVGFVIFLVVCIGIAVLAMIGGVIKDIAEAKSPGMKIFLTIALIVTVVVNIVYLVEDFK